MATIRNTITLQDRMTPVLRSMMTALNSTAQAMSSMDNASNSSFSQMRADINSAQSALNSFTSELNDVPAQTQQVTEGFTIWKGTLANIIGSYLQQIPQLMGRIVSLSDEMTNTTARLNMINDGLQTTTQLQDKIFQAAQRSGASYMSMSDNVAKLAQRAPEIFKTNEEAIRMAETLNKMFAIAGSTQEEQHSATLQLTQALGSGVLRGEEFNAVFEAAPNIMRAIADSMGVPIGQLRNMAAEGMITAETVKAALTSAATDVDAQYAKIPMTWEHLGAYAGNILLKMTQPLLSILGKIAQVIFDNWTAIEPILVGIAAALLYVGVALIFAKVQTWILTGAMKTFFTTLLTNPLFWIAMVIGIVIMAIYKFIQSVGGLQNAWELCKMALQIAWTAIQIAFFTGVNFVMTRMEQMALKFLQVTVKIQNFMGDMKVKVLTILQDMINGCIKLINGFIGLLNKIPGVNIEAVEEVTFATKAAAENNAQKNARNNMLTNAENNATRRQNERQAKINGLQTQLSQQTSALKDTYKQMKNNAKNSSTSVLGGTGTGTTGTSGKGTTVSGGKVDSVGKIDSAVNIENDDIKVLKDLASTKFVNKFTTLQPNLQITFGDVHETADTNSILQTIEDMVEEAYATALSV